MPVLYDQFGRPVSAAKKPDTGVLPVAPLTDAWREYVAAGLTPQRLAAIFRDADNGDVRRQCELFSQMEERDGHLIGEKGKRANVVLDVDFVLSPASDDAHAARVADFVQEHLLDRADWPDILVEFQESIGRGFSCQEIFWDASSGQAVPSGFDVPDPRRFLFVDAQGVLSKTPRLITDSDLMGVDIPPWKTIFHRYGGKSGHPARAGIHRVCAWWYLFKNYSVKDWIVFCEVYGMPLRLGKYSPGASQSDRDALMAAIRSLGSDAAGIISKATEIEFIEGAKGKASGDLYEALAGFANREMSKAILGSTLTADVDGKGSYAAANVHNDVRVDLIRADSRAIAATVRNQVIRPLVGFNFGWDTPSPKYTAKWEEPEDLKAKAEWMDKIVSRVAVPVAWVRGEFGIPEPKDGEETVGGAPLAQAPVAAKLRVAKGQSQQGQEPDAPDLVVARLENSTDALWDAMLVPVRALLEKASTLDDFRDGLASLYPEMEMADLSNLMAQAMTMLDLGGRYEVTREAK